jgi:hypothetical protein
MTISDDIQNTATDSADLKAQPLFDFVDSQEKVLGTIGDEDLFAIRDRLGFRMTQGDGKKNPKARIRLDNVYRLIDFEIDRRWMKEHERLMQSNPFYRLHHDNMPF